MSTWYHWEAVAKGERRKFFFFRIKIVQELAPAWKFFHSGRRTDPHYQWVNGHVWIMTCYLSYIFLLSPHVNISTLMTSCLTLICATGWERGNLLWSFRSGERSSHWGVVYWAIQSGYRVVNVVFLRTDMSICRPSVKPACCVRKSVILLGYRELGWHTLTVWLVSWFSQDQLGWGWTTVIVFIDLHICFLFDFPL